MTGDQATLDAVDAEARLRVLYDDGSRLAGRVLSAAQFNAVRNFLTSRLGFTTAQADAAVGTSVGGRTVAQIVAALVAWLQAA